LACQPHGAISIIPTVSTAKDFTVAHNGDLAPWRTFCIQFVGHNLIDKGGKLVAIAQLN
jgi:hypothetical protein